MAAVFPEEYVLKVFSRTHKAQSPPDQVQGPMFPIHVYAGVKGFGKSG